MNFLRTKASQALLWGGFLAFMGGLILTLSACGVVN